MDRKQAFKKAKRLINMASVLFALRNYDLQDNIDFPLGVNMAKVFKGKMTDIASNNMLVSGLKAKTDRSLYIKLKLEIQRCDNDEIQQLSNALMRIFSNLVIKRADEASLNLGKGVTQKNINNIAKTNNACIYLLEIISREIIMYRTLEDENSKIIDGLSSRMLSYLAIVIRRHMIAQGMDELCEKYNSGSMSEYEESLMAGVKRYQRLLDGVIGELRRRGLNRVEDKVKAADKDVSDYVNNGYVGLFK